MRQSNMSMWMGSTPARRIESFLTSSQESFVVAFLSSYFLGRRGVFLCMIGLSVSLSYGAQVTWIENSSSWYGALNSLPSGRANLGCTRIHASIARIWSPTQVAVIKEMGMWEGRSGWIDCISTTVGQTVNFLSSTKCQWSVVKRWTTSRRTSVIWKTVRFHLEGCISFSLEIFTNSNGSQSFPFPPGQVKETLFICLRLVSYLVLKGLRRWSTSASSCVICSNHNMVLYKVWEGSSFLGKTNG